MTISRREFLRLVGAMGAVSALPTLTVGCGDDDGGMAEYAYDGPLGPESAFRHAVASGDPLADSVILWTRVDTDGVVAGAIDVFLEVAETPDFSTRVSADWYTTDAEVDYTVKVDAVGLAPATTYYFRFSALGRVSPIGRTRTAPAGNGERLRFAVCSCSNYGYGYFYAYRQMARRPDLDAVLHLGDYIYEYATSKEFGQETYGEFRELEPRHEIVALDDYRMRYSQYRRDPDLREVHRQNPMIHVWDDHEFACDPFVGGSVNHDPSVEGAWETRVANALRAYSEWMPTRLGDGGRIFRTLAYGDLVQIVMLDRQRRFIWPAPEDAGQYLGAEQQDWLDQRISETQARWLVFGQGTTFAPRSADGRGRASWDATSRERVYAAVEAAGVRNFVVLTGDIHAAQALDCVRDPAIYDPATGAGSAGVEFACNAISSPGGRSDIRGVPQWFWDEGLYRGYLVIDFTAERMQGDFFGFVDLYKYYEAEPEEKFLSGWIAVEGTNHLVRAAEPLPTRGDTAPLVP